ncbi:MAG: DUF6174 domain-containing protein [Acidimicrobiales bacterium]
MTLSTMTRWLLLIGAVVTLSAACSSPTSQASTEGEQLTLDGELQDSSGEGDDLPVEIALADARVRCSEAGIAGYRLEVSESRNYWRQGCSWVTVVADGVVRNVSVDSPSDSQACFGVEWTVEELHDRIAEWADNIEEFSDPEFGEHTLEVVFDELGVPEAIRFDLANADDEESTLRVIFRGQG